MSAVRTRYLSGTLRAAALAACCLSAPLGSAQSHAPGAQTASERPPTSKAPSVRQPNAAPDSIVWATKRFTYKANGKRLSEVLQDFAASQGLPAIIAEGVDGVVHGDFDAPPSMFLNALSKAYGTIWYHDGTTLYVYPARAMQSRLFRLKGFTRTQLEEMLGSLRMGDRRYPLRYNERESTLLAYGPPRHIEVIGAALESLDAGASERNHTVVRVFPLRYASAGDRMLGNTKVPGVVSTLRGVYGGPAQGQPPAEPDQRGASAMAAQMQAMQQAYGAKGTAPGVERKPATESPAKPPEKSSTGVSPRGVRSPVNLEDDQPNFEADEANNAVIVHGRQSKMAQYAELINRLDLRPMLVELEATIIDVNADEVDSLGINWSARGSRSTISVTAPQQVVPDPAASGKSLGFFTVGTVWANAGRELLARIDALQANGHARVVARPKVLGVANRAAHMQEKRVASVRVAGNLDARLFQLEAGTLLQVTPQVIFQNGTPHIKLSIYIEDGNFETQAVDQVPVVKRTEIRTEAQVVEGESLLIGGITIESQSNDQGGVPGLSKVPVFGGLFRWSGQRTTRIERLFLITPRLMRDTGDRPASAEVSGSQPSEPPPQVVSQEAAPTFTRRTRLR